MPGKVHTHKGKRVYHRPKGSLIIHGKKHARYMPGRDRKIKAKKKTTKGYPHAGDGTYKKKRKR